MLRRLQAVPIMAGQPESMPGREDRALFTAIVRDVRRALADPSRERAGDTWDLALFGTAGGCRSPAISQRGWLMPPRCWRARNLPRHRGTAAPATPVRPKINALARLSESHAGREDHGLAPERLGRPDVEAFPQPAGLLESSGVISRYRRTRSAETGPGRPVRDPRARRPGPARWAAGLPGDVALRRHDIPLSRCGRALAATSPAEIMAVLCANLSACTRSRSEPRPAGSHSTPPAGARKTSSTCRWTAWRVTRTGRAGAVYDNAKPTGCARRLADQARPPPR